MSSHGTRVRETVSTPLKDQKQATMSHSISHPSHSVLQPTSMAQDRHVYSNDPQDALCGKFEGDKSSRGRPFWLVEVEVASHSNVR
jgi:hypothetical protein